MGSGQNRSCFSSWSDKHKAIQHEVGGAKLYKSNFLVKIQRVNSLMEVSINHLHGPLPHPKALGENQEKRNQLSDNTIFSSLLFFQDLVFLLRHDSKVSYFYLYCCNDLYWYPLKSICIFRLLQCTVNRKFTGRKNALFWKSLICIKLYSLHL